MTDLKYALRQLLKNPGFTMVAVLTLMLGIGVNLALFTLLYDQFLRPRPVLRPDELWIIFPSDAGRAPLDARNNSEFTRVALLRAGYGTVLRQFAWNRRDTILKTNSVAAGATLLVLLIAVSNLANLLLARALSRRKEVATRLALGATRWTLIRQLTLEGVLLASLGTISALAVLNWFSGLAPAFMSAAVSTEIPISFQPDPRIIGFAAAIAIIAGIGFSLPPAFYATRFDPIAVLRGAGVGPERRWSMKKIIVVMQVTASLILLSAVFLCLRAIDREVSSDLGFQPEPLVMATIDLEGIDYTAKTAAAVCEDLRQRLGALPGIEAVGTVDGSLFSPYGWGQAVTQRLIGHEGRTVRFKDIYVGPECFRSLGIPILAGREITAGDFIGGRRVAVINESFARTFWPNQQVLGKRIFSEGRNDEHEVVGMVRDARLEKPNEAPEPTVYYSAGAYDALSPTYIIRGLNRPELSIGLVRAELQKLHPRLGQSQILTMRQAMQRPFAAQRRIRDLLGGIAAVALGLTVLGAYGLVSYLTIQRTREIGIRLAVGAQRSDIVKLILRVGLWLALAGISVGLPAAIGGSLLLRHLVYGITPFDFPAFGIASGIVILTITLACCAPAWRAARLDPMETLKSE